jgi:hypothetical protein
MIVVMTSCAPGARLEDAGHEAPQRSAERTCDQRDHQVDPDRKREQEAGERRADRAHDGLALHTDVEQTTAERDGEGETGEGQRGA